MTPKKGAAMRSRTNQIIIRLSDEELAALNEMAGGVRGSRERFIRQCISGAVIREAPPVDVPQLIYEVRRIGNSFSVSPTPSACWTRPSSAGSWRYISWTPTRKTDGR